MNKINIDKNELYDKYIIAGLSQKEVAKYLNCSVDTIVKNLKKYNIESHKPNYKSESKLEIEFTKNEMEILNGALLGDGSYIKHKNCINAQFTYISKSRQHVEFVTNHFSKYSYAEGIKPYEYKDKRTNKTYTRYTFRTIVSKTFTKEYYRWYKNGIKHLPEDLILSPLTCLIWYIGDGCISHSKYSEYIKIATNCFSKEEQEKILIPQLKEFEASLVKADNEQYFIYIPHRKEKEFLEYIGKCPFNDYIYKWEYKEYKTKKPKNHKENEDKFCELYKNGMTYYAIAKQFNIEPNAVKYYLMKNNLYKNLQ